LTDFSDAGLDSDVIQHRSPAQVIVASQSYRRSGASPPRRVKFDFSTMQHPSNGTGNVFIPRCQAAEWDNPGMRHGFWLNGQVQIMESEGLNLRLFSNKENILNPLVHQGNIRDGDNGSLPFSHLFREVTALCFCTSLHTTDAASVVSTSGGEKITHGCRTLRDQHKPPVPFAAI
jgi:hypothetical protein